MTAAATRSDRQQFAVLATNQSWLGLIRTIIYGGENAIGNDCGGIGLSALIFHLAFPFLEGLIFLIMARLQLPEDSKQSERFRRRDSESGGDFSGCC